MRTFPAGVAVVCVDAEGERLGLTVGSLTTLSLEPPLVSAAISRQAAMHELLRAAGAFSASLLAGDQARLAQHFARGVPPIALWDGIDWHPAPTGAPRLDGALGWVECRVTAEHEAGDHTLFVGEATELEQGRRAAGLVYVGREYVPVP